MTDVGEERWGSLLGALSLEQKVRLLTGADTWALHAESAVGLRRVVTSDGPAGVRGEKWDERFPSANVPSPTALAATWDERLLERIGRLLADECRRKGVDVLLAPTVNLHRTPYGGRHFECLSEDPLLTARMGAAYVRGVQSGGVAATVKHFVANDSETDRFTVNALCDERTLRELYLAPFQVIVQEAHAWAVMAAYNAVNGPTMTESPLLRDVLKGEWGFDGLVMSDWNAARSVAAAGEGLLDLVMPGPEGPWGDSLVDAVRAGRVPESAVDGHVVRILRLAARVGALDGVEPAAPPGDGWSEREVAAELRSTAAAGFVLASNRDQLLPLDPSRLRRVAVLGPNASVARTLGGGSATVFPPYVSSPLEGLRAALGPAVEVLHATGGPVGDRVRVAPAELLAVPGDGGQGLEVEFFDADDVRLGSERRHVASLMWWGAISDELQAADVDHLTVRTVLHPDRDGPHAIGVSGLGQFTVRAGAEPVLEADLGLPPGADVVEGMMRPPQQHVLRDLSAGHAVLLEVTYQPARGAALGGAEVAMLTMQLNVGPVLDDDAEFQAAVDLAADSDVAVVVVGTTEEVESEGFDRDSLALPGRQDDLVAAVAGANPRTVVVVNAGAPVLLPWADDVSAVLLAWFPGQEFGNALADVLLGAVEPGGRLPTTWPTSEQHLPSVRPVDGVLPYSEGLFVGYRAYQRDGRSPRYPFGHGLGFTSWEYRAVSAPSSVTAGEDIAVSVEVENTGGRRGREVVQVYASRPDSAIERPVRWLAGFATVDADPGQRVSVSVTVPARSLQHWTGAGAGWATERGPYRLEVGRSVADLPLTSSVEVATA